MEAATERGSAPADRRRGRSGRKRHSVEQELPDPFGALVTPVLAEYYELTAVLIAFGWRAELPQPRGHALPPTDEVTRQRLDRVKRRAKLWQDYGHAG